MLNSIKSESVVNWSVSDYLSCIVCFISRCVSYHLKERFVPRVLQDCLAELVCMMGTQCFTMWPTLCNVNASLRLRSDTHRSPRTRFHVRSAPWDPSHFREHREGIRPTTGIYIKPIQRVPQSRLLIEPSAHLRNAQTVIISDDGKAKESKTKGELLIRIRLPDTKTLPEEYSLSLVQWLGFET